MFIYSVVLCVFCFPLGSRPPRPPSSFSGSPRAPGRAPVLSTRVDGTESGAGCDCGPHSFQWVPRIICFGGASSKPRALLAPFLLRAAVSARPSAITVAMGHLRLRGTESQPSDRPGTYALTSWKEETTEGHRPSHAPASLQGVPRATSVAAGRRRLPTQNRECP